MTAHVRRVPGKMPWELQVACSDCGYVGPVHDVNDDPTAGYDLLRAELAGHTCPDAMDRI